MNSTEKLVESVKAWLPTANIGENGERFLLQLCSRLRSQAEEIKRLREALEEARRRLAIHEAGGPANVQFNDWLANRRLPTTPPPSGDGP